MTMMRGNTEIVVTTGASDSIEPSDLIAVTTGTSTDASDPNAESFRTVSRRLGQVIRLVEDRSWEEAAKEFEALEAQLVPLFAQDSEKLEVQRRMCESILSHVATAKPPPDRTAYEAMWQRMLHLGFSSSERRLTMLFYRLKYLIEHCADPASVQADLASFQHETELLLKEPDPRMGEHFSRVYKALRQKFEEHPSI